MSLPSKLLEQIGRLFVSTEVHFLAIHRSESLAHCDRTSPCLGTKFTYRGYLEHLEEKTNFDNIGPNLAFLAMKLLAECLLYPVGGFIGLS